MKKLLMLIVIMIGITLSANAEGVNLPVAIKCEEGVFLSWPMDESEEYTIYRDGEVIKTTKITNYTDFGADGTGEYKINDKPVTVWNGQFLEVPLNVPEPYAYTYPERYNVTIKPDSAAEIALGSVWTVLPRNEGSFIINPDGKVLDVINLKVDVGSEVRTFSYNGGVNQQFFFEKEQSGYIIKGKQSEKYLAVGEEGNITLQEKENATVFQMEATEELVTEAAENVINRVFPIPPTYGPGDASVGDLDGDGEWEIVLKWDPSNGKDSAHDGASGRVFIDAYELDGTMMWRIDLGVNVRAGAHDTQFLVYDFDQDGKAEVSFRISDGTIDGMGNVIGDGEKDWRNGAGKNLDGPLWVAVFDGETGKMLDKVDFDPQNEGIDTIKSFGDDYGNRSERYNACVAYLDGVTPHMVFQRGYYARTVVAAYTYKNGKITKVWRFDTKDEPYKAYGSNGNHNISVGDGDGYDEIYLGSLTLDNDGSVLWCGFEGHGDAMHLGDFDPDNEGLEFFSVHEAGEFGYTIHDAATGEKIYDIPGTKDTGRGMIANVGPFDGNYIVNVGSGARRINSWGETTEAPDYGNNFRIFWDGDLYEEIMSGTHVVGYNTDGSMADYFDAWPDGFSSINGTKATPCLSADVLGDWREEIICKKIDGTALRIYTTTIPSNFALPPLMTDHVYRMGIAWQNSSYNQPPHLGYYSSGYGKMKINSVDANINGQRYSLNTAPIEAMGDIYVPLEFLCEVSGARMIKDDKNVTVTFKGKERQVVIGENAINLRGTVMVPFDMLSEMLEIRAEYNEHTGEITLLRNDLDFIRYETALLKDEMPYENEYWVNIGEDSVEIYTTREMLAVIAVFENDVVKKASVYRHIGRLDYPKLKSEEVKVFVWDNMKPVVSYNREGELLQRLKIQAFVASSEPEEQNSAKNSFDEDKETVWATFGEQNIVYDLGKLYSLDKVKISFFKYDDTRTIPYEVYVSEDNEVWELIHKGTSPVKSDAFVNISADNTARYIKIILKGNNVNGWSRISEVEFYGG